MEINDDFKEMGGRKTKRTGPLVRLRDKRLDRQNGPLGPYQCQENLVNASSILGVLLC